MNTHQEAPSRASIAGYVLAALTVLVLALWLLSTGPNTVQIGLGFVFGMYVTADLLEQAGRKVGQRRARQLQDWAEADEQEVPFDEPEEWDRLSRWQQEEVKAWPSPLDGEVWPDETATDNLTEKAQQLGRMSPAQRDLHAQHGWPLSKPGPY